MLSYGKQTSYFGLFNIEFSQVVFDCVSVALSLLFFYQEVHITEQNFLMNK